MTQESIMLTEISQYSTVHPLTKEILAKNQVGVMALSIKLVNTVISRFESWITKVRLALHSKATNKMSS